MFDRCVWMLLHCCRHTSYVRWKISLFCWLSLGNIYTSWTKEPQRQRTTFFPPRHRKKKTHRSQCKCRHLKRLTCKGPLRQVFFRVYRLEIANFLRTFSHVGIQHSFVIWTLSCCSSPLLSGSTPPPPFPVWISILYCIYLFSVHIMHEFYTLHLSRFRTCKISTPPQTKT